MTTTPTPAVCPECVNGKHSGCDGSAWDDVNDCPTNCGCTHGDRDRELGEQYARDIGDHLSRDVVFAQLRRQSRGEARSREQDLATVRAQRDRARDVAARLWDEESLSHSQARSAIEAFDQLQTAAARKYATLRAERDAALAFAQLRRQSRGEARSREQDLATVRAERDRARDVAVRLWDEVDQEEMLLRTMDHFADVAVKCEARSNELHAENVALRAQVAAQAAVIEAVRAKCKTWGGDVAAQYIAALLPPAPEPEPAAEVRSWISTDAQYREDVDAATRRLYPKEHPAPAASTDTEATS